MKIGQTGQLLVSQALPQGHMVTAIVRNPGKMTTTHENLKGDIFSENNLKFHFTVVISCLGLPPSWWFGASGYTTSMKAADSTMHEVMVNRENPSGTKSPFLIHFLLLPIIRSVLMNMYEMEQYLKMEYINWTVVRLAGLRNESATGNKEFLTHEEYFIPDASGNPVGSSVARIMLFLLNNDDWMEKGVCRNGFFNSCFLFNE
uniref:NAD(P)-binding domain-containing protein n=1 Tax=Paramormyrops kingsleyae TaxID=1676925 RepID=A0A3B3QQ98_9TELE